MCVYVNGLRYFSSEHTITFLHNTEMPPIHALAELRKTSKAALTEYRAPPSTYIYMYTQSHIYNGPECHSSSQLLTFFLPPPCSLPFPHLLCSSALSFTCFFFYFVLLTFDLNVRFLAVLGVRPLADPYSFRCRLLWFALLSYSPALYLGVHSRVCVSIERQARGALVRVMG